MANNFKYITEEDFYFIMDTLKENLEIYKENRVHIRNFGIKLSNGAEVYFNLHKSTIAHLLGVNTDYLMSLGYFKEVNSYDLLEKIIYNPNILYEYSKNGILNLSALFSDNIFDKNLIFKDLFTLDLNNLYFYSPLVINKEDPNNINYYYGGGLLAYKIPDTKDEYRLVSLSKRNHGKYRSVISHRYYDNKDDFIKDILFFTKGQNITFAVEGMYYEKKDENIRVITRTNKELLENTKIIDELKLPNKVHVLSELKNKYSINGMALEGVNEIFSAKNEYEMLKRLYKVIIKNEDKKKFVDDDNLVQTKDQEDKKI